MILCACTHVRRGGSQNEIDPYSNWRGPIWIVANAFLSYGLNSYGYTQDALTIADNVVAILAQDLSATSTWHECYDSGACGGGSRLMQSAWSAAAA